MPTQLGIAYVLDALSSEESVLIVSVLIVSVLIVDETGFLKKGVHSVGVKRQYTGTAGRIENRQVGVFLCDASRGGAALLDREPYLPEEGAADAERCRAAAVPEGKECATQPELARHMIERPLDAGASVGWIAGDEVYGNNHTLRQWLEHRQLGYVPAVACDQRLRRPDREPRRVDALAEHLPASAWERVSAGSGGKGERLYDWALVPGGQHEGWSYGLLVRRSLEAKPEQACDRFYAPTRKTHLQTLVHVAGQRRQIEQAFQAAKGECGLDRDEVRHGQGWYRHITLAMLAHAVLAVLRSRGETNSKRAGAAQRTGTAPPAHPPALARMARR